MIRVALFIHIQPAGSDLARIWKTYSSAVRSSRIRLTGADEELTPSADIRSRELGISQAAPHELYGDEVFNARCRENVRITRDALDDIARRSQGRIKCIAYEPGVVADAIVSMIYDADEVLAKALEGLGIVIGIPETTRSGTLLLDLVCQDKSAQKQLAKAFRTGRLDNHVFQGSSTLSGVRSRRAEPFHLRFGV